MLCQKDMIYVLVKIHSKNDVPRMSCPNGTKISMGERFDYLSDQYSIGQTRIQAVETIAVCGWTLGCVNISQR